MKKAFISLGTNLGDRNKNLLKAVRYINVGVGHIIDLSGIYETDPWGFDSNDKFLNMVIEIITDLTPEEMLMKCMEIESIMGRSRDESSGYSSRIIDIDILFYADQIIQTKSLKIPHPYLHERNFVLEPLCEIAPDLVHPVLELTIAELLNNSTDQSNVKQLGSLFGDF